MMNKVTAGSQAGAWEPEKGCRGVPKLELGNQKKVKLELGNQKTRKG
jgi:hypothetical protein